MRLIDADALIEILAVMQGQCTTKEALVHNSKIWQQVKDMSTVDAVPVRHAYWIRHEDWEEEGGCGWECSECGMGSEVDYKYCMRCGARMDGAERKKE